MPAAVIVCGADVVHCGEEVGFHLGPVHGEGVGELHRSVDVCPGEFGEHASEQVDGGVAGAQDVGHLSRGQNSLGVLLAGDALQFLFVVGSELGEFIQSLGRQVQQHGGAGELALLVGFEFDPLPGRGHHLSSGQLSQLRAPALSGQPLGDSTDDAAGSHRGVGEPGLDLVAYGSFPALAGHTGAFGPSVLEHLGQPEVVAVDVGVGQSLQRVDVQVSGGVHAVSLSEWSAVAVWLLRWR